MHEEVMKTHYFKKGLNEKITKGKTCKTTNQKEEIKDNKAYLECIGQVFQPFID